MNSNQPIIDGNTPMPYGKFRGKPIGQVPASYLNWFYANSRMAVYFKTPGGFRFPYFKTLPIDRAIQDFILANREPIKAQMEAERRALVKHSINK